MALPDPDLVVDRFAAFAWVGAFGIFLIVLAVALMRAN